MFKTILRSSLTLFMAGAMLSLLGCASMKSSDPNDPLEHYNRKVFAMNDSLDKHVLTPVAKGYNKVVPPEIRKGVTNVFSNALAVPTTANDILQANWFQAFSDGWRFMINTTVGVFGIFDPASHWGFEEHQTNFGTTLGVWGYTDSTFFIIPFLGPSTIRDAIAIPINYYGFTLYPFIRPYWLRYLTIGLYYVNKRANYLGFSDLMEQAAFDPYVFQRNAYLQLRKSEIEQAKNPQYSGRNWEYKEKPAFRRLNPYHYA